jgi:hypothetical protein
MGSSSDSNSFSLTYSESIGIDEGSLMSYRSIDISGLALIEGSLTRGAIGLKPAGIDREGIPVSSLGGLSKAMSPTIDDLTSLLFTAVTFSIMGCSFSRDSKIVFGLDLISS